MGVTAPRRHGGKSELRPARLATVARTLGRRLVTLFRRAVGEFQDDRCTHSAAAISYHLLFSLFPLAIVAVGVLGLVTGGGRAPDNVISAVLHVVPLSPSGEAQLRGSLASVNGGSGALGLIGLVGVLWSASGVMSAIRTALNLAWDTDQRRPFLRGKAIDLLLVAATSVVILAALGITVATSLLRNASHNLPHPLRWAAPFASAAAQVAALLIAAAILFAVFTALYRVVPAVPTSLGDVWPGALAAAVGFELTQFGFSVYVAHFAHYNKVYGSLGAVVAFLFFVYLASAVFLFGAEVASEYPRMKHAAGEHERHRA